MKKIIIFSLLIFIIPWYPVTGRVVLIFIIPWYPVTGRVVLIFIIPWYPVTGRVVLTEKNLYSWFYTLYMKFHNCEIYRERRLLWKEFMEYGKLWGLEPLWNLFSPVKWFVSDILYLFVLNIFKILNFKYLLLSPLNSKLNYTIETRAGNLCVRYS